MADDRGLEELKDMLREHGFQEKHRVAFDTGYYVHMWIGSCVLFVCTWENQRGWDVYLPVQEMRISRCVDAVRRFIEGEEKQDDGNSTADS